MQIRLAEPAQRQVERIEAWWAEHRPAAPDLFAREFLDTLQLIRRNPGVGTRWATPSWPDLQRVLMPRTKHHVYFRFDPHEESVLVLAVWGVPRGRGPSL